MSIAIIHAQHHPPVTPAIACAMIALSEGVGISPPHRRMVVRAQTDRTDTVMPKSPARICCYPYYQAKSVNLTGSVDLTPALYLTWRESRHTQQRWQKRSAQEREPRTAPTASGNLAGSPG